MLKRTRDVLMIGLFLFVVILIVIANAKQLRDAENREFRTLIDGSTVCVGYEFYTYEHQLRMEDPNDPEIYLLTMDPKRDEELRFTIINREKVPEGHFLERYANWEDAEIIYNRAIGQRDLIQSEKDAKKP